MKRKHRERKARREKEGEKRRKGVSVSQKRKLHLDGNSSHGLAELSVASWRKQHTQSERRASRSTRAERKLTGVHVEVRGHVAALIPVMDHNHIRSATVPPVQVHISTSATRTANMRAMHAPDESLLEVHGYT